MLIVVLGMLAVGLLLSAVDGIEDFADFPDDGPTSWKAMMAMTVLSGLVVMMNCWVKAVMTLSWGVMVMTSWKGTLARICCSEVMMRRYRRGQWRRSPIWWQRRR